MAFTVTHDGMNYRISIGDGKPVKARDVESIVRALRHYYVADHKHAGCPFCAATSS